MPQPRNDSMRPGAQHVHDTLDTRPTRAARAQGALLRHLRGTAPNRLGKAAQLREYSLKGTIKIMQQEHEQHSKFRKKVLHNKVKRKKK